MIAPLLAPIVEHLPDGFGDLRADAGAEGFRFIGRLFTPCLRMEGSSAKSQAASRRTS